MKAALIVDGLTVERWQRDALDACGDSLEIVAVLRCGNTRIRRNFVRHFGYFIINALFMRGRWRQSVSLPDAALRAPVIVFDSDYEGAWQRIPAEAAAHARALGAEVAIKFGMNLLADPDALGFPQGVLSYHHGEPEQYRGRPAGFYEFMQGAPYQGIVVQRLSSALDAGGIAARARCKVFNHSYRRTLANAYRHSIPLLRQALEAIAVGKVAPPVRRGRNYRLPSNGYVLAFLARLAVRNLARIGYGAFIEKRWNIAYADASIDALFREGEPMELVPVDAPVTDHRYAFYADPFPFDERLIVEALNRRTGHGELVVLDPSGPIKIADGRRHWSYPGIVWLGDARYLLPETCQWTGPAWWPIGETGALTGEPLPLRGLESLRLVDPTYHREGDHHFLFAGELGSEDDALQLFVTDDPLEGIWRAHPANPVVVDPRSARMAGAVVRHGGRLFRPGQNNSYGYGDGVMLNEIVALTPTSYRERQVRVVRVAGAAGPHSLNLHGNRVVFDFYRDRFTLAAGYRRLAARIAKR